MFESSITRRSFAALLAAAVTALFIRFRKPHVYLTLIPDECPEGIWQSEGETLEIALADLVAQLTKDVEPDPDDDWRDWYREVFAEALDELQSGEQVVRHWDFSSPEAGFHLVHSRHRLEPMPMTWEHEVMEWYAPHAGG